MVASHQDDDYACETSASDWSEWSDINTSSNYSSQNNSQNSQHTAFNRCEDGEEYAATKVGGNQWMNRTPRAKELKKEIFENEAFEREELSAIVDAWLVDDPVLEETTVHKMEESAAIALGASANGFTFEPLMTRASKRRAQSEGKGGERSDRNSYSNNSNSNINNSNSNNASNFKLTVRRSLDLDVFSDSPTKDEKDATMPWDATGCTPAIDDDEEAEREKKRESKCERERERRRRRKLDQPDQNVRRRERDRERRRAKREAEEADFDQDDFLDDDYEEEAMAKRASVRLRKRKGGGARDEMEARFRSLDEMEVQPALVEVASSLYYFEHWNH
jgi:hypothetical protein